GGKGVVVGDKLRQDKTVNPGADFQRPGDEFDVKSLLAGILEVKIGDAVDTDIDDIVRLHKDTVGMCNGDHQLILGIKALYIEARIGLGKPKFLCCFQRVRIRFVLFEDFRENVIGRTIEYSFNTFDEIIVIVFFQVSENGNTTADSAFVQHGSLVLLLQVVDLFQVFGQHFLIGSHNMLAFSQGRLYDFVGGLRFVDEFHDYVDFRIIQDVISFVGEQFGTERSCLIFVLYTNLFNRRLDPLRLFQHVVQALSHATESEEAQC